MTTGRPKNKKKKKRGGFTGRRGPNFETRKKMVNEVPRNFFRKIHEGQGHYISFANAYLRQNGCIYVQYQIAGVRKKHWAPRSKTVWLDEKGLDYARMVVSRWKEANQKSIGSSVPTPQFYLSHRKEYLKFLYNTAGHSTIQGYEKALLQYVFPYFIERLELDHPRKWTQDIIKQWDAILADHLETANSRNRKRTALRRYLDFLFRKNIIKTFPTILGESVIRKTQETPIPGELPHRDDVVAWLRKQPPGRYRFVRAVSKAFGLRVSESLAVTLDDFIGEESRDELMAQGGFVAQLIEKKLGHLFLSVNKATKKTVPRELVRMLGEEQSNDPKSGPYTACCTSKDMAVLINDMIIAGEHEQPLTKDEIYKIKEKTPIDESPFRFDQYNPHDDRRLNITLQCLDLSMDISDVVETACMLHGQSSRDVFGKYFQWGLTQRRKQKRAGGKKLKLFGISY